MLRTSSIPPGTPTRAANLESPASPSGPAGGLTFRLPRDINTARDGTNHRVSSSSQLCSEWRHTLAQTDLAAPVLGLLMTEGHMCFLFCWLFTVFPFLPPKFFFVCFFKDETFLWWTVVLFCTLKKRVFIVVQIYLHLVVLGQGSGYCLSWRVGNKMGWSGEETVFEPLSNFSPRGPF